MSTRSTERDLWALSGMTVAATSAAVASFSWLRGLASAAGWPEHLAWLLPVTVDAYAITSTRLWLAGHTRHRRARRFAAANALGAIVGSAVYHAVSTGLLAVSWPIAVCVGVVPAAVLGLIAHLHALHGRTVGTAEAEFSAVPNLTESPGTGPLLGPAPRPARVRATGTASSSGPVTAPSPCRGIGPVPDRDAGPVARRPSRKRSRYRSEAELMDAARAADQRHRDKHGRPITRDGLRAVLKISGPRASELRRRLAASAPANALTVHVPEEKEVASQQ